MSEYVKHKLIRKWEYDDKIIQKAGDARVYRNCIFLTPGSWTDAITQAPVEYSSDELAKGSNNWIANFLNVDHSYRTNDRVGYAMNPRWFGNAVMGDIHIHPITRTAKDTIAQIDAGLINELSVELLSRDVWSEDQTKLLATDIKFCGLAVVTDGACRDTRITNNPNYRKIDR